ncbi:MAG: nucleotide exchange factor GrpE [Candidatus Bathyarchaeota archaeon]|nr:MAG: nucleotide exchange factor GrpE [Candidatus Bathyarchaeota archaeon]
MTKPQAVKTTKKTSSKTEIKTLSEALSAEKKRTEEYLVRLRYLQADLENFKKRTEREKERIKHFCCESFATSLLEVADELEAARKAATTTTSNAMLLEGVEMTLKKLIKAFANEGVTPIDCVETIFDPSKHHAIERVEQEQVEEGTIIEEIRKGYIMKGKVIRPSIVKIAVKPSRKEVVESNE